MFKVKSFEGQSCSLVTFFNFIAENEGCAVDSPDGFEQVHPHLEEDCQARLSHTRVVSFAPYDYSDKASQSMQ